MNATCEKYSAVNCYCTNGSGSVKFFDTDWGRALTSFLTYFSWRIFVALLQTGSTFRNTDNTNVLSLRQRTPTENNALLDYLCCVLQIPFSLQCLLYAFLWIIWVFFISFVRYYWFPPHSTSSRWHLDLTYNILTVGFIYSFFSQGILPIYNVLKHLWSLQIDDLANELFNITEQHIIKTLLMFWRFWLKMALFFILLYIGFVQLLSNLPNPTKHVTNKERAQQIISTEYTLYIWICLFFSLLTTWRFSLKENGSYIQRSLFANKNANIIVRMFPLVWSCQFLHEFLSLFVEYETFHFIWIWKTLEFKENLHLLFNFLQIITILVCFVISIKKHDFFYIDGYSLTMGFVAFNSIIYFQRTALIYEEFTWIISDLLEVLSGHVFIIISILFLFYIYDSHTKATENQNTREERNQRNSLIEEMTE